MIDLTVACVITFFTGLLGVLIGYLIGSRP